MGLDTNERQDVIYFTGTEVEHTPMKGALTLFIVGVRPVEEIIERAKEENIRHLYFGTSQSFHPKNMEDWTAWTNMIGDLLNEGYVCTLDYLVQYYEQLLEFGFEENDNFISMISVVLPNIKQLNYNATVKIDDTTWGYSNSGVWCHSVHNLMDRRVYTDWRDYVGDEAMN